MIFRSIAFNTLFYVNLAVWLAVCLPGMVLPRRIVKHFLLNWARSSIWLLEHVGGVRMEVRGDTRIRTEPLIVASKHQSLFETFALLPYFADPAYILKRELNWIPLFGWWSMKFAMIPVARGRGSEALKAMTSRTAAEVATGRQVIIFPEGTRRPPGAEPKYKQGVAHLYEACGVAVQPVALNSGLYWPRRRWQRYPGTIVVEFRDPIPPGLPKAEFMARLENEIETASDRLLVEAAESDTPPPLSETAGRRVDELAGA